MIGHCLRHGLVHTNCLADGPDWSKKMAKIPKCDNCGVLHSEQNPVTEKSHDTIYLHNGDVNKPGHLSISISPAAHGKDDHHQYRTRDTCKKCLDDIVRSRFAELCGMLAPYQPARVAGFNQSGIGMTLEEQEEKPLTAAELKALRALGQRLLKA